MDTITITIPLTTENIKRLGIFIDGTPSAEVTCTKKEEFAKEESVKETVTKTDVRALALKLTKSGKQNELKEIFKRFNANKLSDISETDYPALADALRETAVSGNA